MAAEPGAGELRRRAALRWLLLALALAAAVLVVYAPLLLTNRVLATGDAFAYFTPYRDYASAALRAGRLPLWNPYLFLGVPFLANPQTAVFYPLHWPFAGLPAAASLEASLALHLWLAGLGAAVYVRCVARLGWLAALAAGLAFSLSGYLGARAGQINQVSAVAWLPWLLALLEASVPRWRLTPGGERVRQPVAPISWPWLAALALAVALQLLAGHTQSSFINLTGLLLAALWPSLAALLTVLRAALRRQPAAPDRPALRAGVGRALVVLAAILLGALLSAVQLLPTLELSGLSIRSGGLTLREAVSFSLQPRGLLLTLLPSFGENLAGQFATPAYGEYVAYVGVVALVLALVGVTAGRQALASPWGLAVGLALTGLALALGAYNPLYWLLVKLVPGFDLFRAPARWMLLYTFGASLLAAYGVAALSERRPSRPRLVLAQGRARRVAAALTLLLVALLAVQRWPGWLTVGLWLLTGLAVAAIVRWQQGKALLAALLAALLLAELAAASLALAHRQPTAPEAITSLRTAPAHLLAAARQAEAEGRIPGRFLSISGITYDPGDLAELQQIFAGRLPQQGIYDLVVASKLQEIVAPNLPLLWRLPAVDGYDGGVLPLRRYVDLQTLFIPPDDLAEDGRLREQLTSIPATSLLRLLGVEHIITDKTFDLWRDDVYYDLELSTQLAPGEAVTVLDAGRLEATGLGLWSHLSGGAALAQGAPVAEVVVEGAAGSRTLQLRAGEQTGEGVWSSVAAHGQPEARQPWPRHEAGWDYLARADWAEPLLPEHITVRNVAAQGDLVLRGISLLDARTGAHAALTMPADGQFRRVHSGDVKIYENMQALPRAAIVGKITVVADDAAALASLADPGFEPGQHVVLLADELAAAGQMALAEQVDGAAAHTPVQVLAYQPERVELAVTLSAPGALVLADTWYPGWRATVDGEPVKVLRANYLFRGLLLPAGTHRILFEFQPASLARGAAISLVGLLLLVTMGMAGWFGRRRPAEDSRGGDL